MSDPDIPLDPGVGLDPEIAAWLNGHRPPDIDMRDVAAVRALASTYMAESGGPAPRHSDPAVEVFDARIAGIPALVWAPRADRRRRPAHAPAVLAFHGGGFVVGGPLGAERIAVPLAARHGIVTVSVAYRLAPEHRAPAQLDDGFTVLGELARSRRVGTRDLSGALAVYGSSAGGCIAAGVALLARDAGHALALQLLDSPVLDPRAPMDPREDHSMNGYSPTWSREDAVAAWEHYLGPDGAHGYAVPALADDLAGVAPAYISVAQYDVLRDEALDYAARLWSAGVPVTVDRPSGTVHGFTGLLPDSAVARETIAGQVQALARALR